MLLKTIREAAAALDISESKLRRAAQSGTLPVMKLGNRTLVDVDAAREVLAQPEGVNIEAASQQTGLSVSAIRRAVREGWLPYKKPGKAFLFDMDDVTAAIARRMKAQQAKK